VNLPSYSADFTAINDEAIRHDVARTESFGYASTLLATEVAITPEENARITALAREVTSPDFGLFFHAAFNTLEENIAAMRLAEKAGADRVLLSFPTAFWPTSEDEIFEYTKAFCEATDLAVMIFPIPLWQFERVHPAGMQVSLIRRMLDALPNVVAIKYSTDRPDYIRLTELAGHKIHVSNPSEEEWLDNIIELNWKLYLCSTPPFLLQTKNDQRMNEYTRLAFAGDHAAARQVRDSLEPVRQAFKASKPKGKPQAHAKCWQELLGQHGGLVRRPLLQLTDAERAQVATAFAQSGLKR
jgi:4-hydroxy-tetrahydrodipicolinate synthase